MQAGFETNILAPGHHKGFESEKVKKNTFKSPLKMWPAKIRTL